MASDPYQLVRLSPAQLETLAQLAKKHSGVAHIYQHKISKTVLVEFEFPHEYVIAYNGRAINNGR